MLNISISAVESLRICLLGSVNEVRNSGFYLCLGLNVQQCLQTEITSQSNKSEVLMKLENDSMLLRTGGPIKISKVTIGNVTSLHYEYMLKKLTWQ